MQKKIVEFTNLLRKSGVRVSMAESIDAFREEAKAMMSLAALNHPHVAAIYGIEESDARRFIRVWLLGGEWVPGQPTFGCLKFRAALSRG